MYDQVDLDVPVWTDGFIVVDTVRYSPLRIRGREREVRRRVYDLHEHTIYYRYMAATRRNPKPSPKALASRKRTIPRSNDIPRANKKAATEKKVLCLSLLTTTCFSLRLF